jgi:succinate-acetate transporter protein
MSNAAVLPKLSNPAPLGLAGFALTTWLLSMINAGWITGDGMGIVLACALAMAALRRQSPGLWSCRAAIHSALPRF